jgi:hypothetical protein
MEYFIRYEVAESYDHADGSHAAAHHTYSEIYIYDIYLRRDTPLRIQRSVKLIRQRI